MSISTCDKQVYKGTASNQLLYTPAIRTEKCNRNGEMLKNLLLENKLVCLNTLFQKRQGHKWTHTAPNTYTSQIDYVIINKKWKNSAQNCRASPSLVSPLTIESSQHK